MIYANVPGQSPFYLFKVRSAASENSGQRVLKDLPTPNGPVYETLIDAQSTKDSIQVITADSVLYQGKFCLDGSIEYPDPSGRRYIAYFRYVYYDDKLVNFFIAAPVESMTDLVLAKTHFFNSISL